MYIAGDALIVAVYKNRNNSERRMAARIGHEKASKATTRKTPLPRGPYP